MEMLNCPHCGSENNPDSIVCKECGAALSAPPAVAYPPPSYPPPGQSKKGIAGWSTGKKLGISLAVLVALAIVGFIAYRVIKTVTYPEMKLDAPPAGYEQVTEAELEQLKEQFGESEEGGSLDAFYYAGDGSDQIFIAHISSGEITLISFGSSDDPPETTDLSEMQSYIRDNRQLLEDELEDLYRDVAPDAETLLIEAVQLESDGYCGILVSANMPLGEVTMLQDRVIFFKDGVTYVAAVQNVSGASNAEAVQHLLENLYFE